MVYYFPDITKFHGHWSSNRKVTRGGGGERSFRPQIILPTPSKHISTIIPKTGGGGGELPYEEHIGVCHELGSHFQEKILKRACQFLT